MCHPTPRTAGIPLTCFLSSASFQRKPVVIQNHLCEECVNFFVCLRSVCFSEKCTFSFSVVVICFDPYLWLNGGVGRRLCSHAFFSGRSSTPSPSKTAGVRAGRERFAGEAYTVLGTTDTLYSLLARGHGAQVERPTSDWESQVWFLLWLNVWPLCHSLQSWV